MSAFGPLSSPARTAALIWNPVSGRGADDLVEVRQALEPHFALRVFETSAERDADACARDALADGPELVIAAGGDGTVSLVAATLVGSDVPLGILARGTSNSIAAGLGIPEDLALAVRNLVEGEVRALDTARANGRTMVLHASVGFQAAAVGNTDREAKHRWGVLAYVKEGIAVLRSLEPFHVELETEAEIVRCLATNVTIANIAPTKTLLAQGPSVISPEDGELDITIVATTGIGDAVATGLHLLRTAAQGEAATRDNVGFLSAPRVRITTDPPQPLLVDGEDAGHGTLSIVCLPRSLRVIVPTAPSPAKPDEEKLEGLPELEVELK